MHAKRHDAMTTVANACADSGEVLALSIIRMLAAGYSTGDVACWDLAYVGAERVLDPEMAGKLVASLTTLIRSVRTEQAIGWAFMPVTCCRVTKDEERVLDLIGSARRGGPGAISQSAATLTGSFESDRVEAAARIVARLLDETVEPSPR